MDANDMAPRRVSAVRVLRIFFLLSVGTVSVTLYLQMWLSYITSQAAMPVIWVYDVNLTEIEAADALRRARALQVNVSEVEHWFGGRVAMFDSAMTKYYEDFAAVRNVSVANIDRTWEISMFSVPTILNAEDIEYYATIQNFSQVKTILLEINYTMTSQLFVDAYYDYASTDCRLFQKKSRSSESFFLMKLAYGRNCLGTVEDSLKPYPLYKNKLGLPFDLARVSPDTLTFMHIIENAVITTNGNILTGDLILMPSACQVQWNKDRESLDSLPLYDEVITIAQRQDSYYHSMTQEVTRLAPYVPLLWKYPSIKVHVHNVMHVRFLIDLLGIDPSRIVTGTSKARVVYVPAGMPCNFFPTFQTQYLSALLRYRTGLSNNATSDMFRRDLVILIKRSVDDTEKRYFKHHDAIASMLKNHTIPRNLTLVEYAEDELPSPVETAMMFGRAVMVVSPHGGGESNILFSQPGTILIEAMAYTLSSTAVNGTIASTCFRQLSQVLGMRYYAVVHEKPVNSITAEDLEGPVLEYLTLMDRGYVIPPEDQGFE